MFLHEQPRNTEARTCEYRMPSSCRTLSESSCRVRFFALARSRPLLLDASAVVLDGHVDGLGRGADPLGPLRRGLRVGSGLAPALEAGRVVRRIHGGSPALVGRVGARFDAAVPTADATTGWPLVDASRLVCASRGRVADRGPPNRGTHNRE